MEMIEVITNNLFASPIATFSLGTFIGGASAYYVLQARQKAAVPTEERFEFPDLKDEIRLVVAIRSDLKMQKGKVAAQCGHASIAAYASASKVDPKLLREWLRYGGTKITVRVDSEQQLLDLEDRARANGVLCSLICDDGRTQIAPGSLTVAAVGPAPRSILDKVTGHLKLY